MSGIRFLTQAFVFLASLGSFLPDVQASSSSWHVVQDFSGSTFFDKWDFFDNYDNFTGGAVVWPSRVDTLAQGLAFINSVGNAVLKVDNTSTVLAPNRRNSTRITTQQGFELGSIFVADIVHMPFGCSVWPAFWTKGVWTKDADWPHGGEIDILEGVNLNTHNIMAIHTAKGCSCPATTTGKKKGKTSLMDCSQDVGCAVNETKANSFGDGFNRNGGGVFAAKFDISGVFIWFFPRNEIPQSLLSATPTSSIASLSDWGIPSASYPSSSSCDIPTYFDAQNLVISIDLCGDFAGLPHVYLPHCADQGPQKLCYPDSVLGSGSNYYNAYFEFKYIRVYGNENSTVTGGTNTVSKVTSNTRSGVGNVESLWLLSWICVAAAVIQIGLLLS